MNKEEMAYCFCCCLHDWLYFFYMKCLCMLQASQTTELDCLIPLQYGCTKLVLVGDPEQLPATVISQVLCHASWYSIITGFPQQLGNQQNPVKQKKIPSWLGREFDNILPKTREKTVFTCDVTRITEVWAVDVCIIASAKQRFYISSVSVCRHCRHWQNWIDLQD